MLTDPIKDWAIMLRPSQLALLPFSKRCSLTLIKAEEDGPCKNSLPGFSRKACIGNKDSKGQSTLFPEPVSSHVFTYSNSRQS